MDDDNPFAVFGKVEPESKGDAGEQPQLPRLKIVHLFLWMTCSAGLIALGELANQARELPEELVGWMRVQAAATSVFSGLAVAGAITLFAQATRGSQTAFRYTGHWLLCQLGVATISYRSVAAVAGLLSDNLFGFENWEIIYGLIAVGVAVVPIAALFVTQPSNSWKAYLVYNSACHLGYAAFWGMLATQKLALAPISIGWISAGLRIASTLGTVMLLVIWIGEIRRARQRDWLHSAGIICVVAGTAISWVLNLLQPLIMS